MSTLNDAFWHKGQREIVSSCALGNITLAINGSEQLTWSAIDFMVNGTMGSATASGSAGSGTVLNTTNYASGPSAANPVLTKNDDSTNGDVTVRQNAIGLSVADGQQVKIVVTISGTPSDLATTKAALRFYAGEVVSNTASCYFPNLDFSNEAPVATIVMNNDSGGALTVGGAASMEEMTITNIGMLVAE